MNNIPKGFFHPPITPGAGKGGEKIRDFPTIWVSWYPGVCSSTEPKILLALKGFEVGGSDPPPNIFLLSLPGLWPVWVDHDAPHPPGRGGVQWPKPTFHPHFQKRTHPSPPRGMGVPQVFSECTWGGNETCGKGLPSVTHSISLLSPPFLFYCSCWPEGQG